MSSKTTVLDLSGLIFGQFDRGKSVATFWDLSKAFGTLNRLILIRKLSCYSTDDRALQWSVSYFIQQKQFENMLYGTSLTIPIDNGIALGSCYGLLTFVIYTKDIVRCSNIS